MKHGILLAAMVFPLLVKAEAIPPEQECNGGGTQAPEAPAGWEGSRCELRSDGLGDTLPLGVPSGISGFWGGVNANNPDRMDVSFVLDLEDLGSFTGRIQVAELSLSTASSGYPINGQEIIRLWVEEDGALYRLSMEYGEHTTSGYQTTNAIGPTRTLAPGWNVIELLFSRRPEMGYNGVVRTRVYNYYYPGSYGQLAVGGQYLYGIAPQTLVIGMLDYDPLIQGSPLYLEPGGHIVYWNYQEFPD